MLCSRSASLTSSTRASSAMASSSLRKFSACWACLVTKSSLLSLVRPSTRPPISSPNALSISTRVFLGVFDGVVQHRRHDRGVVELEIGEDRGDFERMREIRIAGGALLRAVRHHREDVSAVEHVFVGFGIVAADPFHQFVLPHHRRNVSTCLLSRIPVRRPARSKHDGSAGLQGREGKPPRLGATCRTLPRGFGTDHRPPDARSQAQNRSAPGAVVKFAWTRPARAARAGRPRRAASRKKNPGACAPGLFVSIDQAAIRSNG